MNECASLVRIKNNFRVSNQTRPKIKVEIKLGERLYYETCLETFRQASALFIVYILYIDWTPSLTTYCMFVHMYLTFSVEITSSLFSLELVVMEYRGLRSGSITVSPRSQRMMMGYSPRAVQFNSLFCPFMAMVVFGWDVIIAGTAQKEGIVGKLVKMCEGKKYFKKEAEVSVTLTRHLAFLWHGAVSVNMSLFNSSITFSHSLAGSFPLE